MKLFETQNLLQLFFNQCEKQNEKKIFIESLKEPSKKYSWKKTKSEVINLSNEIQLNIEKNDRCLLISENRPEWLISDIAIMLAGGITVPAYATYVERDYEYIINDCCPSVIIIAPANFSWRV